MTKNRKKKERTFVRLIKIASVVLTTLVFTIGIGLYSPNVVKYAEHTAEVSL